MGYGRTELKNESREALTRLLARIMTDIKDDLSAKLWEITYLYDGISE